MTVTTKTRRDLTPVRVTAEYRSVSTGRDETWTAESADGKWRYLRLDLPRTPWTVLDAATGAECGPWFSSLPKARAYTGSGEAARDLAAAKLAALREECAAAGITAESPAGMDDETERLYRLEKET